MTDFALRAVPLLARVGADRRAVWAMRGPLPDGPGAPMDVRRDAVGLDDLSAQLLVTALPLLNWHDNARFSPADATPLRPARAGWARVDPVTGHEEFPRIDPAVIVLVHDGADRMVLARQHGWPDRMFSLLAGFVEARWFTREQVRAALAAGDWTAAADSATKAEFLVRAGRAREEDSRVGTPVHCPVAGVGEGDGGNGQCAAGEDQRRERAGTRAAAVRRPD